MRAKNLPIHIFVGTEQRNLAEELYIDQSDLALELASQPSWYAYYAHLMAQANIDYDQVKGECDNLQAEISNMIRAESARDSKKITEKHLEYSVAQNSRMQAKKRQVAEKRNQYEMLKVVVRAFEQRLQALISLCTLERIQFRGEENTGNPVPRYGGKINKKKDREGSTDSSSRAVESSISSREEMMAEIQRLRDLPPEEEE